MIRTVLQSLRKSPADAPAVPARVGLYYPQIFEADSLEAAKAIAITPEEGMSTDERWNSETSFVMDHIASRLKIGEKNVIVDFGCGVGRMSRALIQRYGCAVVGVDQSEKMRGYAVEYVASPRFEVLSAAQFDAKVAGGFAADFALASWVLQHCVNPADEIARIANSLAAEAPFLLINSVHRLVPTTEGWGQDGADLDALMGKRFRLLERMQFPQGLTSDSLRDNSIIAWWQRTV